MKRFLATALLCVVAISFATSAFAQEMVPGSSELAKVIVPIRHYNNLWGQNTTLTTPLPADSAYSTHLGARVDTTTWIALKDLKFGDFPNWAGSSQAVDSTFAFRLSFAPPSFVTTAATNDSGYYAVQFAENVNMPIADQNVTTCKGVGITGSGFFSQNFFTLPTNTFKHNEFFGTPFVRFIITWPANTSVLTYRQVALYYYTNRLTSQR